MDATMRLVAVVAMASNRVIGRDGDLPWQFPEDLKFFKSLTMGHPIVMGRKTFESIGRPLPKRRNIVLSRTLEQAPEGCELIGSIDELGPGGLDLRGTVYVIGGTQIYAALLPALSEIILTFVHEPHEGDTFFPRFEDRFELSEVLLRSEDYERRRYVARDT